MSGLQTTLALFLLLGTCSLSDVILQLTQPHGQRIISLSEITLLQGGHELPNHLIRLSFSEPTEIHNDPIFCKDSNRFTFCQNEVSFNTATGVWEGDEDGPSLYIHLVDAFFDELVCLLSCSISIFSLLDLYTCGPCLTFACTDM